MKRVDERFLEILRARQRAERNAELASRLEIPRTTEDMIKALRALEGFHVSEREQAQKKELVLS